MVRTIRDNQNDEFEARSKMLGYFLRKDIQKQLELEQELGTCFKGYKYMTARNLNPNPLKVAQMRKQNYW